MYKANIKLPLWLAIIAVLVSVIFTSFKFNPIAVIIYLGTLYLIVYFCFGYIKRKDAFIIDNEFIRVKSPFKYNEWKIEEIKQVFIADNGSMLKAIVIEDEEDIEVTLCSNIYDKNLREILDYLVKTHDRLNTNKENL